jgi:hypothetical protein
MQTNIVEKLVIRGLIYYLLTDYRSNNMVTISDRKLQHTTNYIKLIFEPLKKLLNLLRQS